MIRLDVPRVKIVVEQYDEGENGPTYSETYLFLNSTNEQGDLIIKEINEVLKKHEVEV